MCIATRPPSAETMWTRTGTQNQMTGLNQIFSLVPRARGQPSHRCIRRVPLVNTLFTRDCAAAFGGIRRPLGLRLGRGFEAVDSTAQRGFVLNHRAPPPARTGKRTPTAPQTGFGGEADLTTTTSDRESISAVLLAWPPLSPVALRGTTIRAEGRRHQTRDSERDGRGQRGPDVADAEVARAESSANARTAKRTAATSSADRLLADQ
jgi:hypothetical protein